MSQIKGKQYDSSTKSQIFIIMKWK